MLTMVASISVTVCLLNEMREVLSLPDLLLTLRITAQLDGGITGFVLPSSKRQQLSHPRKTNLLLSSWQTLDLAEKEKRRVSLHHIVGPKAGGLGTFVEPLSPR